VSWLTAPLISASIFAVFISTEIVLFICVI
jgi:hypothetical protein